MKDRIRVKGHLTAILLSEDNMVKQVVEKDNMIVTSGLEYIADRLNTNPEYNAMSHYAIGTSTTETTVDNTSLVTEIARVSLDPQFRSGGEISYVAGFLPGVGTGSITEAGIFNASSGGSMLARLTFPTIIKSATDTLIMIHKITVIAL